MKKTSEMRLIHALIFFFCAIGSWAQLAQVPIVRTASPVKKNNSSARVQQLSALTLPFWDDFSFNNPFHIDSLENFPSDSLWQYGRSVWVNTGMGINTPTYKVATFDGLDSLGIPYVTTNPLAKGYADKLVSRPLRLDLVDPAQRDSVFIFFYYQWGGNGEAPETGDNLALWFKNDSSVWNMVWSVDVDSTSDQTKFVAVKLPIGDSSYFHSNFQFYFQNFARLSGQFDSWNLDYVYINNGKSQYTPVYADFPDRAIAMPLTSAFVQYQSIPVWHFLTNPDSLLAFPSLPVTNQRKDQTIAANYPQPVNLVAHLTTTSRLNNVVTQSTSLLDSLPAQTVYHDQATLFTLNNKPTLTGLDPKTDSIALKFQIKLNTGDNVKKISPNVGDYDTVVYKGMEFRYNDTISTNFILRNYYAYDDGGAEYAVTLTQPGSSLMYEFDMDYPKPDTLVGVNVYFPHVGDESNQVVKLQILDSLAANSIDSTSTTSPAILTQQDLTIQRTEYNHFVNVPLVQFVLVKKKFYVGWIQNSTAAIGVGYDKSSDSGSKIFYNTTGVWQQNTVLNGNLMIRPIFGNCPAGRKGNCIDSVTTAVEVKRTYAYPNPNRGRFYLPPSVQALTMIDVTGRNVSFVEEDFLDQTQVTISSPSAGLYLARYFNGTQWRTEKIMVLP
jgi:hypothetical protein